MSKPWSNFRVGALSNRANWVEPDCVPLTSVAHVAHVPTALRIVEDERLRADLVFDDSKLNTKRIRVVWLSPNDWTNAGGFRYGNVRFHFDWLELVANKRTYWVESIAYKTEACRILLSDNDYSGTLEDYDPSAGDGPWWRSASGEHYWNGRYCLEVMLEADLPLDRVKKVDFVDHKQLGCSIDPRTCKYCGVEARSGGAEFVAAQVSRTRTLKKLPGLLRDDGKGGLRPAESLDSAVGVLLDRCAKAGLAKGDVVHSDSCASAVARAILASLGNPRNQEDLGELVSLFATTDDAKRAIAQVFSSAVGLQDATRFLV